MPTYDNKCSKCGHEDVMYIQSSQVNDTFECRECGEKAVTRIWKKMPGTTKASYIDSATTARGKEMKVMKDVANLEVQKAGMKPSERADINKEIHERKKITK